MKKNIKCRSCLTNKSYPIYKSPKLPEYIWPIISNIKIRRSSCILYLCRYCGHLQLQKFSTIRVKSFYGKKSFVISTGKQHQIRKNLLLKKYGRKLFYRKKILEIGGGINPFLPSLSDYTLLDFSFEKFIKQKYKKLIKADFEKFKDSSTKYDIVIMFHALEHFINPHKIIKNLNKITHKKSLIIVEVPNICHYINEIPHYAIFHQHLSMFTPETLINVMKCGNFKLDKKFYYKTNILMSFKLSNKKLSMNNYFKKNFELVKKLINKININNNRYKKIKTKFINVSNAGGNTTLFLNTYPSLKNNIKFIYENDFAKINKKIPGTKIKILKKVKGKKYHQFKSFF